MERQEEDGTALYSIAALSEPDVLSVPERV